MISTNKAATITERNSAPAKEGCGTTDSIVAASPSSSTILPCHNGNHNEIHDDNDDQVHIPVELLGEHVAPFLDRLSVNRLSLANQSMRRIIQTNPLLKLPWPQQRFCMTAANCTTIMGCPTFSSDGDYLACLDSQGTITIIHRIEGPQTSLETGMEDIRCMVFSSSRVDRLFATGHGDGTIHLWKIHDRTFVQRLTRPHRNSEVRTVVFSPDGTLLAASIGHDRLIQIWNILDGTCIETFHPRRDRRTVSHGGQFWVSLAFSPDGTTVAAGGFDGILCAWKWTDPSSQRFWSNRSDDEVSNGCPVILTAFTQDGAYIATGDGQGIQVRRLSDHCVIRKIRMDYYLPVYDQIQSLALSSDGSLAAGADSRGQTRIWSMKTGRCLAIHSGSHVAFAPGHRAFATTHSNCLYLHGKAPQDFFR